MLIVHLIPAKSFFTQVHVKMRLDLVVFVVHCIIIFKRLRVSLWFLDFERPDLFCDCWFL